MQQNLAGFEFGLVGVIDPDRDDTGALLEFMPQARYARASSVPLNPHGAGPFCKFSVARGENRPGVYVLTLNGTPVYAGKCADLAKRWGVLGYGGISPKNCFVGGQSTNCKINNRVLVHAKAGECLELWFRVTEEASAVERSVIRALDPAWNSQVPW